MLQMSERNGPLLGLAGLLIAGFVVGLLAGAVWARIGQEGISESDYMVMVSLLYERDRSIPNAVGRLAVLEDGEVSHAISSLANSFPKTHPEAQSEALALHDLASALNSSSGGTQAQKSGSGRSNGLGGPWLLLGMALVFVCFLGVGGPFALHFARSPRRGLPRPLDGLLRRVGAAPANRPLRRPSISVGPARPIRRDIAPPSNESELQENDHQASLARPSSAIKEARHPGRGLKEDLSRRGGSVTKGDAPRRGGFTLRRSQAFEGSDVDEERALQRKSDWTPMSGTDLSFQSAYEFGEDPFDEVHPILDKVTGELIGACGLSAELKLADEAPGRYYTFSVWAHDYAAHSQTLALGEGFGSRGKLKRVAIVSKWAKGSGPVELVRWIDRNKVEDVVAANQGMRLFIDTANLAVDVTIVSFRYGNDVEVPPDSCFANLVASFQVKIKEPSDPLSSSGRGLA